MENICNQCNYTAKFQHHYDAHLKSFRHKKNVLEYKKNQKKTKKEQDGNKKHVCSYCPAEFSTQSGMLRHQNKCKNDEIAKLKLCMEQQRQQTEIESRLKQIELENKLKQAEMENEIKILRIKLESSESVNKTFIKGKDETIEILKNQSVATNTIASKSVSALTYLVMKHKDAPPLLQIEREDTKKLLRYGKDDDLTNNILNKYSSGMLDEFIGDIIVGFYKKSNPDDQSIWNSDASRLTFLIKNIVGDKSEWTFTKAEALAPVLCDC